MNWFQKKFAELTSLEVYRIIQLRERVFILEQNAVYLDCDDLDQDAIHLGFARDDQILGYCRILAPGVKYTESSIGRVVTAKEARGVGLGKDVVTRALEVCKNKYPKSGVRISAQAYLEGFYREFGFTRVSEDPYLEDGIPHVEMLFSSNS